MEKLYRIACRTMLFVVVSLALCIPNLAQNVCSLVVKAKSPDGRIPNASITVKEPSGRAITRKQKGDGVKFCDLGILPVQVIVGSSGMCNQVTVNEVPVSLERTYMLQVLYDPAACPEVGKSPVPTCDLLFRVTGEHGDWISGATIDLVVGDRRYAPLRTDIYGRALAGLPVGSFARGTVTSSRFMPKKFEARCSSSDPEEQSIQLSNQ